VTLSNVYNLLGFHKSAYETFKSVADVNDRKVVSKLYAMGEKAKSHKNNFILKDVRKLREKQEIVQLQESDFLISEVDESEAKVAKNVVIFNKIVASDNVEISNYGKHKFVAYVDQIAEFVVWLGGCKNELIEFYNRELSQFSEEVADDDWYYTLEVFRLRITIGKNENLYAEIASGDDHVQDHILDIEIGDHSVLGMTYDG